MSDAALRPRASRRGRSRESVADLANLAGKARKNYRDIFASEARA